MHTKDGQHPHTAKEKKFACSYCESKFADASTLKRHERVHTGEKPFLCTFCNKAFAREDARDVHVNRIHTKAKCKK